MKYDRLKIERLISSLKEARGQLQRLAGQNKEIFLSDPDKIASAKYNLIVAIEAAVDICQHLIAKNNLRIAEDYGDTFRILTEAGVLPAALLPSLLNMARFRNRLVHIYWNIDNETVYRILQDHLIDLDRFLQELAIIL